MPTPDEVDADGTYGPFDYLEGLATISRWQSETYEGRSIPAGRWYHVMSIDGVTSFGMIQNFPDESYAFEPNAVGRGIAGVVVRSLNDGIRALTRK